MNSIDGIIVVLVLIFAYKIYVSKNCKITKDGFAVDTTSVRTNSTYNYYQFNGMTVCYGVSPVINTNQSMVITLPVSYADASMMFPVASLADNTGSPSWGVSAAATGVNQITIFNNEALPSRINWQVTGLTTDKSGNVGVAVDGGYTAYADWKTIPCDPGTLTKTRRRTCTNPAPAFGGLNCDILGPTSETISCVMPVNGGWSDWITNGCDPVTGKVVSKRTCTNPAPAGDGLPCVGDDTKTEDCALTTNPTSRWYTVGNITVCVGVTPQPLTWNGVVRVTLPFSYTSVNTMFPIITTSIMSAGSTKVANVTPTAKNEITIYGPDVRAGGGINVYYQVMGW